MAMWTNHTMTIKGATADLKKFMAKAEQPYTTFHKGSFITKEDGTKTYDADAVVEQEHEATLSFWNFKKPENQEAYFASSDGEVKPDGYETWTIMEKVLWDMQAKGNGWYSWNNREWGTKWDASNSQVSGDPKDGIVVYTFSTANGMATEALQAIVEQHAELDFDIFCLYEEGSGVELTTMMCENEDGVEVQELTETNSWDIPESHDEWESIGEECRNCAYGDDDDKYDDCPDGAKEVAEAVQAFEDISELI